MKIKILLSLFISLIISYVSAQAPNGYYNTAEGKNGAELKTALYNIIKGHVQYPYTSSSSVDVWDILKETDRDPNNPNNVILIYTGLSVNAAQEYNNGKGWTREHVWAKIHGNFGTELGAGTDAHHLRPCAVEVNSERSSRWFAECTTPVYYNGTATGCYKGTSEWTWKPRAEVQGDVARMIFYMATRYEGENGEPDLELIDYLPTNNNSTAPLFAKLSDLLVWNLIDPIDEFEMNRNNVIFKYQKNRNPFIDHPEYANLIWGEGSNSPMFTSHPITDARVGLPYQYDISAYVIDSSQLTYSLQQAPSWLELTDYGNGTALLAGIPDSDAKGSYVVSINVSSDSQHSVNQEFYIDVENFTLSTEQPEQKPQIIINDNKLFIINTKCYSVQIFDILGNLCKKTNYSDYIDVSDLKRGIYILEINNGITSQKQRFAVN